MSTPNEPWDDPRITAYVMDDLIPTETAQFEAEMQQQPPLANAVDEARRVTEKLAGFYAAMPTMTLDEARRERIFGASITTRKGSSADLGYSGRRIAIWAIAASVLFIAIALPLWQMRETRTASNPISERTPSQVRNITESQPDLVKPTAAEPDGDARVSSMLDVADDREDTDAPQSRSTTEEKAQSADSVPMMRSAQARVMSAPPPSAPEPALARGAIAKKSVEAESIADNMQMESSSKGMDSDMMGSDEAMKGLDASMMGRDARMSGKAMPQETLGRRAMMEPAAEMAAKPTNRGAGPGSPGDKFSLLGENEFRRVAEHPHSTFSIHVNSASYAKVRSDLQNNQLPRPDAVRIEEMVNYFEYDYDGPTAIDGETGDPFAATMTAAICPWNPKHRLVRVGLQAKRLAEQSPGTLVTVAKDVKIQVEFNPTVVSAYRLIGYENRLLAEEDFNDDTKDAGEIDAGHQVTALYEVVPVGVEVDATSPPVNALKSQARATPDPVPSSAADDLGDNDDAKPTSSEMLILQLRYKQPQGTTSDLMTRVLDDSQTPFDEVDGDFRFATSVAAFGMLLRKSPLAGSWTYNDVVRVAEDSIGSDAHGVRSEFVGLVKIAESLTVSD